LVIEISFLTATRDAKPGATLSAGPRNIPVASGTIGTAVHSAGCAARADLCAQRSIGFQ
jgi:hypothetical protein